MTPQNVTFHLDQVKEFVFEYKGKTYTMSVEWFVKTFLEEQI